MGEPKVKNYASFDEMTWPGHWDADEVEYRLRHAPELATREDLMHAATVMAAYRELINCTAEKRRHVVREIRKQTPEANRA
jgi:hypothetical protein